MIRAAGLMERGSAGGLRAAAAVAVSCLAATAWAASGSCDVRVGFDGVYRTGSWTPLVVEFSAAAAPAQVCVWVEDPDGQYVRSPVAPVVAGGDPARRVARLTVRFGRPTARVLVEELPAGGTGIACDPATLTRRAVTAPIASTDAVMIVLGDLPAAERAARLLASEDGTRPRVVAIAPAAGRDGAGGAADVSRSAIAADVNGRSAADFDGADSIVVCGRAAAALEPEMLRGIDDWVRQGGRLVIAAGGSAVDVQRVGGPAATWLPGPVAKMVPLRRGGALEAYARASRPLDKAALTTLEVPLLENARAVAGSVEAFEGRGPAELPLVVRRAHGFGTVTWIGIDLDQPPFRSWSGSDSLLVELLGERGKLKRTDDRRRDTLDLAGQLRQAIDQFPGVAPLPFEVIAGLGILYVACLYPLDWWLATRRSRAGDNAWATWLTLPLFVAVASGLAAWAGHRWKGVEWRTSAAEVIDLDSGSGQVRGRGFTGIWAPENAALDLVAAPDRRRLPVVPATTADRTAPETVVTWFAACGRGIGGTDAAAPHPSLAAADYGYASSPAGLDGIPIAASSSRLFEAEIATTLETAAVDSSLEREAQGTLRGTVTNRLPFPLDACVLVHAGWLYDVGRLEPGQGFQPAASRGPRSLAGALTRRTANRDREVNIRWDPAERDPLRILEVAGLHAAAGGNGYTSMEPGRLSRFDLSPLLPLNRAVLVGKGPSFVAWQCRARLLDGTTAAAPAVPPAANPACLWRIVIPLADLAAASTPLPPPDVP